MPITPRDRVSHQYRLQAHKGNTLVGRKDARKGISPQAGLGPALPVFNDSGWPPLPRSSVPAWTTIVRYTHQQQNTKSQQHGQNQTHPHHAVRANQLDKMVLDPARRVALRVRLKVTQVTDMAFGVIWRAVVLAMRVEVRASASTAVGVIAKLVDVHPTLGIWIVTLDFVLDNGGRRLGLLREGHAASDLGVAAEDSNCEVGVSGWLGFMVEG